MGLQPVPQLLELAQGGAERAHNLARFATRSANVEAGYDRRLMHVQADTVFHDGVHQFLPTKDRKADRYAARFIQSLPCVLPVAGGDEGQYPSGGAGQTP
jgi:hypothetical protein